MAISQETEVSAGFEDTSGNTLSGLTITNGDMLVVTIATEDPSEYFATAISWEAPTPQALTAYLQEEYETSLYNTVEIWYLRNPTPGTYDIDFTMAGESNDVTIEAHSLVDCADQAPEAQSHSQYANATDVTTVVNVVSAGSWIIDVCSTGEVTTPTADETDTMDWHEDSGGTMSGFGGHTLAASTGNKTVGYNVTDTPNRSIIGAAAFAPAAAGTSVSADVDPLILTDLNPTVNYHIKATSVLDALILTDLNATVAIGVNVDVTATLDSLSLTEYAAVVNAAVVIGSGVDSLILTGYNATVQTGTNINVAAALDTLSLTEYSADVNASLNITTGLDALLLTQNSAGISVGLNIATGLDSLTLTEYNSVVNSSILVSCAADALSLTEYATVISIATGTTYTARLAGINVITGKFEFIIGKINLS